MKNVKNLIICYVAITLALIISGEKLLLDLSKELSELKQEYNNMVECNERLILDYEKAIDQFDTDATLLLNSIEPLKDIDKKQYIIYYNAIIERYKGCDISATEMDNVYDRFTEEQIQMMWKCIETETFDCPFEAKVNVANVILNRVYDDLYPTDPVEIITDTNQFAYGRDIITEETKLALEYAFAIEDTTNGCIGFRSDKKVSQWNGWEYSFEDGYHYFYSYRKE